MSCGTDPKQSCNMKKAALGGRSNMNGSAGCLLQQHASPGFIQSFPHLFSTIAPLQLKASSVLYMFLLLSALKNYLFIYFLGEVGMDPNWFYTVILPVFVSLIPILYPLCSPTIFTDIKILDSLLILLLSLPLLFVAVVLTIVGFSIAHNPAPSPVP